MHPPPAPDDGARRPAPDAPVPGRWMSESPRCPPLHQLAVATDARDAAYDMVLLAHVLSALVGLGAVVVAGAYALALGRSGPGSEAVRRYYRPGVNWAGRVLFLVPVFGVALVAMSQGDWSFSDALDLDRAGAVGRGGRRGRDGAVAGGAPAAGGRCRDRTPRPISRRRWPVSAATAPAPGRVPAVAACRRSSWCWWRPASSWWPSPEPVDGRRQAGRVPAGEVLDPVDEVGAQPVRLAGRPRCRAAGSTARGSSRRSHAGPGGPRGRSGGRPHRTRSGDWGRGARRSGRGPRTPPRPGWPSCRTAAPCPRRAAPRPTARCPRSPSGASR